MPRKSFLLLLPISFFLIVAPLAHANSINNLTQLDSGNSFTLYGADWRGFFALTPDSIVHLFPGTFGCSCLAFAASIPAGWTFESGPVTFTISINGGPGLSGVPGVGPCPTNIPCVAFGLGGSPISAMTPATLTFTFSGPNGGTETANFFVSNTTPEPPTLFLFGTGGVLVGAMFRYRMTTRRRIV